MNTLPVRTWNHLRVNDANEKHAFTALSSNRARFSLAPEGIPVSQTPLFERFTPSNLGEAFDQTLMAQSPEIHALEITDAQDTPIVLNLSAEGRTSSLLLDLLVHENAKAHVLLILRGQNAQASELVRAQLQKGASLQITICHLLSGESRVHTGIASVCQEGASFAVTRIESGEGHCATGSQVLLEGKESKYHLEQFYLRTDHQSMDVSDTCVHTGKRTVSEMHSRGILMDHAEKVLRGTIDFQKGAVNAVGHETEDVLLLSPDVINRSAPLILCAEEQVEGQHAASIGQISDEEMYYLLSRGIAKAQAQILLAHARLNQVLDHVPDTQLRDEVRAFVAERMEQHA